MAGQTQYELSAAKGCFFAAEGQCALLEAIGDWRTKKMTADDAQITLQATVTQQRAVYWLVFCA